MIHPPNNNLPNQVNLKSQCLYYTLNLINQSENYPSDDYAKIKPSVKWE